MNVWNTWRQPGQGKESLCKRNTVQFSGRAGPGRGGPGRAPGKHSLFLYLDLKPEGPRGGVEAVRVEDEVLAAQVELRRPVPEGPGGQAGPPVRHQVEGHVARTCAGRRRTSVKPSSKHGRALNHRLLTSNLSKMQKPTWLL